MKKIIVLAVVLMSCVGCEVDREVSIITGAPSKVCVDGVQYLQVCVDGVQYLQFTSGATVQVNADGKPIACK